MSQLPTNIEQNIRETAMGPASASNGAGSVTNHNLKDMIEADKYLSAKEAMRRKTLPIRTAVVRPPAAR